jgi:hypothetical protein
MRTCSGDSSTPHRRGPACPRRTLNGWAIVSGDRDLLDAGLEEAPVWTPRELADRLADA